MKKKKKRRKPRSAKTEGPKSPYWRDKADTLFSDMERAKVGECQICHKKGTARKSDGLEISGLELHHLIDRGRFRFRYDPNNTVILDKHHHGSHPMFRNHKICAHGSMTAFEAFEEWLQEELPEKWKWYQNNKHDKRPMDGTYQDKYEQLTEA